MKVWLVSTEGEHKILNTSRQYVYNTTCTFSDLHVPKHCVIVIINFGVTYRTLFKLGHKFIITFIIFSQEMIMVHVDTQGMYMSGSIY